MKRQSHGTGEFKKEDFSVFGKDSLIENGVLVFHPENIEIGDDVYVGHQTILKGYYQNKMIIGNETWIGQQCFFHSAAGLLIGKRVGIGPGVKILTSQHIDQGKNHPILHSPISFAPVQIDDDVDIGVGSIILPGVHVGKGSIIGAGSVVTKNVDPYSVIAGVPAKLLRQRK